MASGDLSKTEQDPFLGDAGPSSVPSWSDCTSCEHCGCELRRNSSSLRRRLCQDVLIILGLTTIIVGLVSWTMTRPENTRKAHEALSEINIKIQRRPYGLMHTSPYVGHNYSEVDAAWDKLLDSVNLRVSTAELSKQSPDTTSIDLPNGGHLAWLGVFHELHCIKMLRKMNYREHYLPNMTTDQLLDHQVHVDHCIDQLREATMCRADTESLTTFVWEAGYDKPLLSPNRPLHSCVDWQTLTNSIGSRIVPQEEIQKATSPTSS